MLLTLPLALAFLAAGVVVMRATEGYAGMLLWGGLFAASATWLPSGKARVQAIALGIVASLLAPASIVISYAASEFGGAFLLLLLFVSVPFLLAWWYLAPSDAHRSRLSAVATAIGLAVVLRQAVLGLRWNRLHTEAVAIIDFLEEERRRSDAYPEDLSGYEWTHPHLAHRIWYWPPETEAVVNYSIASRDTSMSVGSVSGWKHWPD